jgi:hypothetical protein
MLDQDFVHLLITFLMGGLIGSLITLVITHVMHTAEIQRRDQLARSEANTRIWQDALRRLGGSHE